MLNVTGNRTLGSVLSYHAERQPTEPFLLFEAAGGDRETLTYAKFDGRVDALARVLHALGVENGDRVHLHLGNCPE
jgi:acyl-CoA synthetase (AMP-forming)/AMP-acid ligase II